MSSSSSSSAVVERLTENSVALQSLTDSHAAVAITLHFATLAYRTGIKCVAITDEQVQSEKGLPSVPPNWAANGQDGFCFQYLVTPTASSSSSSSTPLTLLVKSIRLDRTLVLHATCRKSGNESSASPSVESLEINVDDHINKDSLTPADSGSSSSSSRSHPDFEKLFKDLPSLIALYERNILSKLLPSGDDSASSSTKQHAEQETRPHPYPSRDPYPANPRRPDDDQPEGFDPLRVYPQRGGRGQFAGDLDPLTGGPGGNLMGPQQFQPRGGVRGGPPGMGPRFDPYGPVPGMGEPDFDELLPPGPGGPIADIGGPLGRGNRGLGGPRRGGSGGSGGFNQGFGGSGGFL